MGRRSVQVRGGIGVSVILGVLLALSSVSWACTTNHNAGDPWFCPTRSATTGCDHALSTWKNITAGTTMFLSLMGGSSQIDNYTWITFRYGIPTTDGVNSAKCMTGTDFVANTSFPQAKNPWTTGNMGGGSRVISNDALVMPSSANTYVVCGVLTSGAKDASGNPLNGTTHILITTI